MATQTLMASVSRWSHVGMGAVSESPVTPDVSFVEPMLRRRLSPLARMVLRVAEDCSSGLSNIRVVFASRHGELVRTTTLLESLADGEWLSPTLFSTSVLNSSVGLYSILKQNTAASSAVSGGVSSFCYGWLEACLQFAEDPEQPVLFLYADEPAPAVFQAQEPPGLRAHAFGALLENTGDLLLSVSLTDRVDIPLDAPLLEPPAQAFLRCLVDGKAAWTGEGRSWQWARLS